ncbi:carboxypeptidase-like regulatory domain-containing protein [Hymenobacter elongatus]|uniref:carboxypeptidase-like regulatory domain-containing protein n=1 Tax=Hymenobacter elongatus TaxID=877208 RepID=UPI0014366CAD|nr:carboxypeptidase regulatory-like domain-containing protein [Hymenobacter elongatus]
MACAPLTGQVTDADGQPISSVTVMIKGTRNVYLSDTEGRFELTAPVYREQVLVVEAAGYLARVVPMTDCTLPVLTLERDPSMRIRRSGKRAGQVTRSNNAYLE